MPIIFQTRRSPAPSPQPVSVPEPVVPESTVAKPAGSERFGPGRVVLAGRYVIERELARGAFGAVVVVRERAGGGLFAMKIAREPKNRRLLKKEADHLRLLQHGPHVLPFREFRQTEGGPAFLVTAFLDGGDLMDVVRARGVLDDEAALVLVRQIGLALSHAHACQPPILHRDVKPANILRRTGGPQGDAWFLADWGLADTWENPEEPNVSGTYAYTAPEVWQKRRYPVSDVYSLGMSLYYALFGKPAYAGETEEVASAQRDEQPIVIPGACSPRMRRLLAGMLAKEPDARWSLQQVGAFVAEPVRRGGIVIRSRIGQRP